jgi:hypothetical protein
MWADRQDAVSETATAAGLMDEEVESFLYGDG